VFISVSVCPVAAEDILPLALPPGSTGEGEGGAGREERVVLAVLEAARWVTFQNAQQWHRAIGR
jgi:hypothetical protein